MARVIHRLAALGYVGRYRLLRASDVGAAHRRERVFILAWPAHTPCPRLETRRQGRLRGCTGSGIDLLPTPAAARAGRQRSASAGAAVRHSLDAITHLLPTPRASDGAKGGPNQRGSSGDLMLPAAVQPERFGPYAPAIHRWETVTGCQAPDPTELGRTGNPRLAPRFVEWLMGLDDGWVTDHVGRNAALRALGNGVVPQQGAAALAALLTATEETP